MGLALRENKEALSAIVSYEMGKIYQEGMGEVQEMIDIADFALGQSRMLYGNNTHSERENRRLTPSSTIRWGWWVLSPLLISPWPRGPGIPCWPSSRATRWYGNLHQRWYCAPWP
ncbi:MAG: aldehyde dehydrogenase family protein [Bacteroidales bacterium]|nr:aldehyde dehydrogenase family protein [Bacteroidales bacterium]